MDNLTNNNLSSKDSTNQEQVVWSTKKPSVRKKYLLAGIFAATLVLVTAVGSFYFVQNLNQASVPNAPESQPQAAYKSKAIKSWNGGDDCQKGCGANEYCEDGRCRKSGGSGDARSPLQQQLGYGTQLVVTPTKALLSDYVCTPENCPSPEFHCASSNNCLPSAGYCEGKLCNGTCVGSGNSWDCKEGDYGLPQGKTAGNINDCGGAKCAIGFQYCDAATQTCQAIPGITSGVDRCNGIAPDIAGIQNCCVPPGVGVDPNTNEVDQRTHWTNCASGTTCKQGVGCIGSNGTVVRDTRETELTTVVTTVTTPVTIPPTVTITVSPTATPTATITATPSATLTVTTTPTIVSCNENCTEDSDCVSGLFCDSESNKCRNSECSTENSCVCPISTPEPTIVGCNKRCNSDDNCSTGLKCDSESGRCRKPACSDEKDCSCPKPQKTDSPTREVTRRMTRTAAQPTVLKEAGILDFPGAAIFGSGLLLTVIGILLAL